MPLVVGIDEAGYGPLLGPLVVGATLWRLPATLATADLWDVLASAVCRVAGRVAKHEARLPIGDSKKVFDRKRGLHTLERPVLAAAQVAGLPCDRLASFLPALSFRCQDYRGGCPWYHDLDGPLPLDPQRSAFSGAAARLTQALEEAHMQCLDLRAEVFAEDDYNRRIAKTRNKAVVVIEAVLRHIQWAANRAGGDDLYVRVDRLGGRADYAPRLHEAFPDRHLHVLACTPEHSAYRLASQTSDWFVEFTVDGDQHHLPIALASMLAKYVRELLMQRFNAFWAARDPDLRPTAGYYSDAQRFLQDIAPLLSHVPLERQVFVRSL